MAPPSLPQPLGRLPGESPSWDDGQSRDDDQSWDDDRLPGAPARSPVRPPGHEYAHRPQHFQGPEVFGLPAAPASVGLARGTVRELLSTWGAAPELCDDAVLVVSELVTNALTHTGSDRIVCRLRVTGGRLRIEVEDQNRGTTLPERRQPDPDDQNGRGLILVGALTSDWGAGNCAHGSGCVVWAELAWKEAELALGVARSPVRKAEAPVGDVPTGEAAMSEAESRDGEAEASGSETGSRGWETDSRGREAHSHGWETESPSSTARPVASRATSPRVTSSPCGGEPSWAAAASVPTGSRPRVTSPHLTRPVSRSAEGHLPHGTPAHP
jgi:anti-sigma regulatory factor (Ser/Thr protein kinase)